MLEKNFCCNGYSGSTKNSQNMMLRISYFNSLNSFKLWLFLTLFFWWTGFAGRDLYLLPAIVFLGICFLQFRKGIFQNELKKIVNEFSKIRFWVCIYLIHVGLYLTTTIFKYYSFNWNIWDVGNYSNMLFNISLGQFYSSYLGIHNWADHFTPSISPLSLLYLIYPTTHWITLAKTIAYVSVPILIFKICMGYFEEKESAWKVTLLLGISWMLLYKPALNSLYYEFQSSAIAPPFILYSFLCFRRKNWILFWITMFFLLGLKEHLGSVWIGFGLFIFFSSEYKKTGVFLIVSGIFSIYIIMFQIMPFFQNYQSSWSGSIDPFNDILRKLIYLIKILAPLGFLPLIFWRYGIIAGPAIGVNLLASDLRSSMYSTSFHYDDLSATLLIISMIVIFSDWDSQMFKLKWIKKYESSLLILWFAFTLSLLPSSPMREFYVSIPREDHWLIREELMKFDKLSTTESIAVQTSLGPQLYRKNIFAIEQKKNGKCEPILSDSSRIEPEYLVFAKSLNHYLIEDIGRCLKNLTSSSDYKSIPGYYFLDIFKKY